MRRIGVLTSGGDAPGMNAAVMAVAKAARYHGMSLIGIKRGYNGTLCRSHHVEDDMVELDLDTILDIADQPGTYLRTARCLDFLRPEMRAHAVSNIHEMGIEGIVVIGGDGSYHGAMELCELGVPCVDLDDYIEERCEAPISLIFKQRGERGFREIERRALVEVAASATGSVVACGGGTPTWAGNMELMNGAGLTIWLTTSPERIAARLALPEQKAKRPLIAEMQDSEILRYVKENRARREPCYSQAQLRFDSTRIETARETVATARELAALLRTVL